MHAQRRSRAIIRMRCILVFSVAAFDVRPGWDKHCLVQNPCRNVR